MNCQNESIFKILQNTFNMAEREQFQSFAIKTQTDADAGQKSNVMKFID